MFFKNKVRVITDGEQTDFAERFETLDKIREESKYATRKDVLIMSGVPTVGAVGLFAYNKAANTFSVSDSAVTVQSIQQPIQAPVEHITPLVDSYSSITIPVNASVQKTGLIADTSLEMLATILDPVIQILVAISFPIASVIMVGACFFFMIGNGEKAWSMIMNAGLGYVLIQLSPLFLDILRVIGEAV